MDFKLPKLGEGADGGVIVNLFVKEGDFVAREQAVLELESEKAVASIPSSVEGAVTRVFVRVGDKVASGARIFSVGVPDASPESAPSPLAAPKSDLRASAADAVDVSEPLASDTPPAAAPSIRKVALELGIELARIRGTGRGGRIELGDLRNYIARLQKLASAPRLGDAAVPSKPSMEQVDYSKWGPILKKPVTPLRQTIARRMAENWNAIPHVTQFDEADITGLLELRRKHAPAYEQKGARLTVTGLILKAVSDVLRKHPLFNSSLDESAGEIVLKEYIHIGIAVDTEAGLMVPVIRDANKKTVFQLSKDLEEVGRKARERKVTGDDLKGGSFTISNQGAIGGGHFTPIINKPEVAILGLGKGVLKPVVRDGRVEVRTLLPVSISYDHRVIDGGNAARFAVDLVGAIQNFSGADLAL